MRPTHSPLRWSTPVRDDRGSLPLALLVVLIGGALAALLLPIVLTQSHTTRFDSRRAIALQAAESGLDATLGLIRTASTMNSVTGELEGDARKLPCGPLAGTVDDASRGNYQVTITYFTADPSKQNDTWRKGHAMACASGYGVSYTNDKNTIFLVPSFALVTSTGTDTASDTSRTLQATYVVNTINVNVSGGQLPLYPQKEDKDHPHPVTYCLDAGDSPQVGSSVRIEPCATGSVPDSQKWSYRSNLTIRLTATAGDKDINKNKTGLCIKSNGSGADVTLTKCPPDKTDKDGNPVLGDWDVTWGINDSGHFALSNSDESDLSDSCLNAKPLTADTKVDVTGCTGGTTDLNQTFNPRPRVGSGQAGPDEPQQDYLDHKQVVNFELFSRCIDVTNQSTAGGENGGSFLILYPCKQNPNPSKLAWNQKFTQVDVGDGKVQWQTNPGSKYCLTSPLHVYNPDIPKNVRKYYVHVAKCASGNKGQVWTRYESHEGEGADRHALPSRQRYTMVDSAGLCLGRSANDDDYNQNLKLVVADCNGGPGQKWNVPPVEQRPTFTDLHEGVSVGEG